MARKEVIASTICTSPAKREHVSGTRSVTLTRTPKTISRFMIGLLSQIYFCYNLKQFQWKSETKKVCHGRIYRRGGGGEVHPAPIRADPLVKEIFRKLVNFLDINALN